MIKIKVIILNSGLGKRMGEFTLNNHKSMAVLSNGETIFQRQLRILSECGLKNFLITTGPFQNQIIETTQQNQFKDCTFEFVENPLYDKTNYIYSIYLAREHINDDVLLLHGDLVFNKKLIKDLLKDSRLSLATANQELSLPDKDFKCRIINNQIKEVSINIFDDNCFTFQPLYKLAKKDMTLWMDKIIEFVENKEDQVYAENALNTITNKVKIKPFYYRNYFIDEVDNLEDLKRVSDEIRRFDFAEQEKYIDVDLENTINDILKKNKAKNVFVVTTSSSKDRINKILKNNSNLNYKIFTNFSSNPKYEEVVKGVEKFKRGKYDFIISIGGGSAIDVAKSIKLFSELDKVDLYFNQVYKFCSIKHLCIPTTAGTGSESTRYAVLYYEGEKKSIHHDSIFPEYTILNSNLLETLPLFQKKVTLLDSFCQAIESYWSLNSTTESKVFSEKAIKLILVNYQAYINEEVGSYSNILLASNLSGHAINITETTAPHALSYKITSLYDIPHGQAVALSLPYVWDEIYTNYQDTIDLRGADYLLDTLNSLAKIFNVNTIEASIDKFIDIYNELDLTDPILIENSELDELVQSVNLRRLSNTPIQLDEEIIRSIYEDILIDNDILEIQKYSLEILLEVDKVCKEHDITYYLGEGTLLGAVRHAGFIPWDDDVDILMVRQDYEKFLEIAEEALPAHLRVETAKTVPNHYVVQAKVRMINDVGFFQPGVKEKLGEGGPYIDIFPLDYVPRAGGKKQIKQGSWVHRLRRIMFYKHKVSNNFSRKSWYILFLLSKVMPVKYIRKLIDREMQRYNNPDFDYLVNLGSYYPSYKQTFPKIVYGKPVYTKFEGYLLPIPQDSHFVLRSIYDDYMKYPKLCKRKPKHNFTFENEE